MVSRDSAAPCSQSTFARFVPYCTFAAQDNGHLKEGGLGADVRMKVCV